MEHLPAPRIPRWLERELPFQRYRVSVGAYRMHVMECGHGRPVLLLHGNPTWGFLYRKVAKALTGEELRLIMPDLIGLGLSDKPTDPTEHQLDHHGAWLGRLIDELELEGLVGVGQDWGGPVLLRALADRPGLCAGLVILNTVVGPPRRGFKSTAFHRFARMPLVSDLAFQGLGLPERLLFLAQGDKRSIRGKAARAYVYPLRKRAARVGPLALARMVPDSYDHASIQPLRRCQSFVEDFDGPVSIVWGERDPVLGSVGRYVQRLLPRAEVTTTQAGHFLQEEVPEAIASAVRSVCSRIASGDTAKAASSTDS